MGNQFGMLIGFLKYHTRVKLTKVKIINEPSFVYIKLQHIKIVED